MKYNIIITELQIIQELQRDAGLYSKYLQLPPEIRQEFLDFCRGARGLKMMYDPFFKHFLYGEKNFSRLESLIGNIIGQKVKVRQLLPTESDRLTADGSLLIMDILVELEDGSLANVEFQKIGYLFLGERGACYSSDLIMRQYTKVQSRLKEKFSYKQMRPVYTIVLLEKSSREFHDVPDSYIHHFCQRSDTRLQLNLLQEYFYVPIDIFLDIFRDKYHNKIRSELDAWLLFLASDKPEDIYRLIEAYPMFEEIYNEIFRFRRNPKELIGMFSEALKIMDRNTVRLMVEEQQEEIRQLKEQNRRAEEKMQRKLQEEEKRMQGKLQEAEEENKRLKRLLLSRDKTV